MLRHDAEGQTTRHGRMTYTLSARSIDHRLQAELVESTLVDARLSDCVTTLLNRSPFKDAKGCSGQALLHFRPQKKNKRRPGPHRPFTKVICDDRSLVPRRY